MGASVQAGGPAGVISGFATVSEPELAGPVGLGWRWTGPFIQWPLVVTSRGPGRVSLYP